MDHEAALHAGTPSPARTAGEVISPGTIVGDPNPYKVTYAKNPVIRPQPVRRAPVQRWRSAIEPSRTRTDRTGIRRRNRTLWIDTKGILAEYHAHLRADGAPRSGIVPGARRLTVAELALLQTFPANLTFAGSSTSQYIQVGNAVPPGL